MRVPTRRLPMPIVVVVTVSLRGFGRVRWVFVLMVTVVTLHMNLCC